MDFNIQYTIGLSSTWMENRFHRWEATGQRTACKELGMKTLFLVVSEALSFVAAAYHSLALAIKLVPTTVRFLLVNAAVGKAQRLGKQLPQWATWQRLKIDHARPLREACLSVLLAPVCLTDKSCALAHRLRDQRQKILPLSEPLPSAATKAWLIAKRPAVFAAASICTSLMILYLLRRGDFQIPEDPTQENAGPKLQRQNQENSTWTNEQHGAVNQQEMKICEANGGVWKSFTPSILGDGGCDWNDIRAYYIYRQVCEQNGNNWIPRYSEEFPYGSCDWDQDPIIRQIYLNEEKVVKSWMPRDYRSFFKEEFADIIASYVGSRLKHTGDNVSRIFELYVELRHRFDELRHQVKGINSMSCDVEWKRKKNGEIFPSHWEWLAANPCRLRHR